MNILFDFDGTICDSLDTLLLIVNPVLKLLKKGEITNNDVRSKGVEQVLIDKNLPRIILPFIVIYGRYKIAKLIPTLSPFAGIPEVVNELSKKNTLGIVTSNSKSNVSKFLGNNNLETYFKFVYQSINYLDKSARIEGALKSNGLRKSETIFVGDETRDVRSAKIVGIKTIGVSWGSESKKLLSRSIPDAIVDKPHELLSKIYEVF